MLDRWRAQRHLLTPQDREEVLRRLVRVTLPDEDSDAVRDPKAFNSLVSGEIEQQADQILADAQTEFNAFDRLRAQAAREYGRVDYLVIICSGAVLGYLLCLFLLPAEFPLTSDLPNAGYTPVILAALIAGFAVRGFLWYWRRSRLFRDVPVAHQRWLYALQEEALRPFIIQRQNDEDPRLFDVVLDQKVPPRLTEGTEPKRLVVTTAMNRIRTIARDIHSGSLAVSGPRGVGKSAIIHFLCDDRYDGSAAGNDLRILVSAPVDYDPREFIIYLFNRLCRAVLQDPRVTPSLVHETKRHVDELRYLRTYTTTWSGTLTLFKSLFSAAASRAKQQAEQPITLPELVEKYCDYSERVAGWLRSLSPGTGRIIIGIDEIDKIADSERAEVFLNDIKAMFGVPGCLYLASLSEDAMAVFARRALTIRTTFDSAFDEVISVGPMTYENSEQLLFKRATGLFRPFLALCHVMSGGLPRDLVRSVRALVDVAVDGGEFLPEAAKVLVRRDIEPLRQAMLRQLAGLPGTSPLLGLLHRQDWPGQTPGELTQAAARLSAMSAGIPDEGAGEAAQACRELVVSLSFYATVLTVFGAKHELVVSQLRNRRYDMIDDLAIARNAMRMNVTLAHDLLDEYLHKNGMTLSNVSS